MLSQFMIDLEADARKAEAQASGLLLAAATSGVVLFGAGSLGRKALACLRRAGIEPKAFSDNNRSLWGKAIDGLTVLPPAEACSTFGAQSCFIVTIWSPGHRYINTRDQLLSLGCKLVSPVTCLFRSCPDAMLPHFLFDMPSRFLQESAAIEAGLRLMADEESQCHYLAQLRLRLVGDLESLPSAHSQAPYFAADLFAPIDGELLVDGGAFDGDTIRAFIHWVGQRKNGVVAYEPDPSNWERLNGFLDDLPHEERQRIRPRPVALADHNGVVFFDAAGATGSSIVEMGTVKVECRTLDSDLAGEVPTLIKLDVEGAELSTLRGAASLIKRCRPLLAICVYHRPHDLWRIPLFLKSLVSDYAFHLRSHQDDGWETVLYAIPPERAERRDRCPGESARKQESE